MKLANTVTGRSAIALVAMALVAVVTPVTAESRAERDRRRRIFRQVQRTLSQLRYDPGPADGSWGGKTASALTAFQRDHGLRRTGRLNAETLDRLFKAKPARSRRRRRRR